MENIRLKTQTKLLIFGIIVLIISAIFFNKNNIKCNYYGDLVLDKLLGFNSDCYERKIKGIIYPLVKNLKARYDYLENKKVVNCPKNTTVIVISGQSNASNFLKSPKKYKNQHYNYFKGKCYNLSNPVLGAEGEMSSLIPAIANKLDSSKKIIFLTSGRGSMSIANANDKSGSFIDYNKEALEELEKNNNILKTFVWIQGESDLGNSQYYIYNFQNMFEGITKNLKKKNEIDLIITQTSKCFDKEDPLLREKQKHISISRNKYIEVINTDSLGNEYRYDKCHYNELGIEKLSNDISNIIIKLNK